VTLIRQVADNVFTTMGKTVGYKIGTMIEIPRAALVADEVSNGQYFPYFRKNIIILLFPFSF
jgi:pyruvate, orthophosphate dikinase